MAVIVGVCIVVAFALAGLFAVIVFFEGDDPAAPPSRMRERIAAREGRR